VAFPLYKCDDDFPTRIEGALRGDGLTVESVPEDEAKLTEFSRAFSYRVRSGRGVVRMTGSEDNEECVVFIVAGQSANPLTWRPSAKLWHQVEKLMLQHGAELIEPDEMD
jgi:hypothetical protein